MTPSKRGGAPQRAPRKSAAASTATGTVRVAGDGARSRSSKSLPNVWRDGIRDSSLDRTAKSVAWCLSTYMDRRGFAFPSQETIARGASLSDRAVYKATLRLEGAGFLEVEWSRGRGSHKYVAQLPVTANGVRRSEWANGEAASGLHVVPNPERDAPNPEPHAPNPERRSHESAESAEPVTSSPLMGGATTNGNTRETTSTPVLDGVVSF